MAKRSLDYPGGPDDGITNDLIKRRHREICPQTRGGRCEEIPHERVSGQFPFKQGSGVRLIKN